MEAVTNLKEYIGKRLDKVILSYLQSSKHQVKGENISRSFVELFIPQGVYVNGVAAKNSYKVKGDEKIELDINILYEMQAIRNQEGNYETLSQKGNLVIIDETDDWLVINKPSGIAVHPSAGNSSNTIANYVKYYLSQKNGGGKGLLRDGIVHRLDKQVSGLMIIAKTPEFQAYIMDQFVQKRVTKRYVAYTEKIGKSRLNVDLREGEFITVEGHMQRDGGNRIRREFTAGGDGKASASRLKLLADNKVEIELITGRTHQIRATMRALGYAILGDKLYGATFAYDDKHIDLRCEYLWFTDQEGKQHGYKLPNTKHPV